ncbi:hypothetical protein OEZ86_007896 [Tetradesmus obliquus]|nr:hypothetical protein OEZ86_007896 [Tetradesmus obliquus]
MSSRSRRCPCSLGQRSAACLLLLAVTAQAAHALLLPIQQQQQQFTLSTAKTLTLIFRTKPLQQQPTPPPAYKDAPMWRWDFLGGEGYLLVTRGDMGPLIGVLSEMMWFPGKFKPSCSNHTFYSAQRFWVDMPISQQIGRTYWGFPKELAKFEWTSTSVTVRDPASGKAFFSANLTAADQARDMPAWFPAFVKYGYNTLQWPIKDAKVTVSNVLSFDVGVPPSAEEAADAAAEAAVAASLLAGTRAASAADVNAAAAALAASNSSSAALVPNRQMLRFPKYDALVLTRAVSISFDSYVFTGRENETVQIVESRDVGFVNGSPGQLDDPKPFTCRKAAAGQR